MARKSNSRDINLIISVDDQGTQVVKKATKEISGDLNKMGTAAQTTATGLERMKMKIKEAGGVMPMFGKVMKSQVAVMGMAMGIPMAAGAIIGKVKAEISEFIKVAEDFARAWGNVTTNIMDSSVDVEHMKWQLIGLSATLGSSTDMAKGMYQVLSAAVDPAKAIDFLAISAKTAKAGFTDVFTAVDALTTVVNAYGLQAEEATRISDVMFASVFRGKQTYEGMAGALGTIVPIASQVGIRFEEIAAAMATMTRSGVDVNTTTVQLRQILVSTLNPTKEAADEAKRIGLEFSNAAVAGKGLQGFLQDVMVKTKGDSEALTKLFGNVRALTGVLALSGAQAQGFAGDLKLMGNSAGFTDIAFKKQMKSSAFWADTLKNVSEKVKIALFEGVTEQFFGAVESAEQFDVVINKIVESFRTFGETAGPAFTATLGIIMKQVGDVTAALKFADDFLKTFGIGGKSRRSGEFVKAQASTTSGQFGGSATPVGRRELGIREVDFKKAIDQTKTLKEVVKLGVDYVKRNMSDLSDAEGDFILKVMENRKKYFNETAKMPGIWGNVAMAIKSTKDQLSKMLEESATTDEFLQKVRNWRAAFKLAASGIKEIKDPLRMTEEELKTYSEMLKRIGVTTKDELTKKLQESVAYLKDYKNQLAPDEEKKLIESIKTLKIQLGELDGTFALLGIKTVPEVNAEMDKLEKVFAKLAKAKKEGTISATQYAAGVEEVTQQAKALDSTVVVSSTGIKKLGRDFDSVLPPAKDFGDILANMPKIDKKQFDISSFPGGFTNAKEAAEALGVTLKSMVNKNLADMEQAYLALKQAAKDQGVESLMTKEDEYDAVVKLAEFYKKLGIDVPKEYAKIIAAGKGASASTIENMSKAFATLSTALQVLGDSVPEQFQAMVSAGAVAADQLSQALAEGLDFGDAIKKVGPVIAGQLGGGIAQAITGNKSKFAGMGAALGGVVGSFFGPIGKIVGSFFGGLIGGLFGGKSKEEKAADKLKKDIASMQKSYSVLGTISETLAKQFIELKKEIGAVRAEAQLLNEMMSETGITAKNFSAYVGKIGNILSAMKTGAIEANEGLKLLNESLGAFITGMVDMGREGDKVFVNLIKKFRTMGLSVKEVDNYVYDWLARASTGLAKMTMAIAPGIEGLHDMEMTLADLIARQKKLAPSSAEYKDLAKDVDELNKKIKTVKDGSVDAQRQIDNVSIAILASFNAYIEQGKSWYEAMTELGDPLANLSMKLEALGLTGNEAIARLLKISDFAKANRELFEAIDGNREVMEALGNTGFLTSETLKATTDQAAIYYKKLTDAGLDSHDALALMAPTLADAVYYAKQLGIPLDDATQALIDQAKAAGVYTEKAKSLEDVLKEGFDKMVDRMDRLIDRFGRAFPDAINRGFDVLDQRAADSAAYLDDLNPDVDVASRRGIPRTGAASGFHGTVVGPRMFYVEPGVKERVDIGRQQEQKQQVTIIERTDTFEPIVLPLKELEMLVIKWVKKASEGERLPLSGRSIRG